MTTELERLELVLAATTEDLRREFRRAEQQSGSTTRKLERDMRRIDSVVARAGRGLRNALATAGIGIGVTALTRQVSSLVREFAAIGDTADNIGITAERLQELQYAASQSGSSADQMTDALVRLNRRLGLAAQGGGPAINAFRDLGIAVEDANGNVRDVESVFDDVVRAMEGVESQAERAALASQLFGEDAGPGLNQLLSRGVEGVAELSSQASVLSDDLVERAQRASAEWERFTTVVGVHAVEGVLRLQAAIESLVAPANLPDQMGLEQAREELETITAQVNEIEERLNNADRNTIGAAAFTDLRALVDRRLALLSRVRELEGNQPELPPPPGTAPGVVAPEGGRSGARVAATPDPNARAQQFIEALERQIAAVNQQTAALTRSEDQMVRWRTMMEQANIVADENAQITPEQARQMQQLTDRLAEATRGFEEQRTAIEETERAVEEAAEGFGEMRGVLLATGRTFGDFASSAITDLDNIGDAASRLVQRLADLALQMSVIRPIEAGFENMIEGGSFMEGVSDFFGGFGGFFARGGRPPVGMPSIVGEDGPELFVPASAGRVIPNNQLGSMGGPVFHVDMRGASVEAVERLEQFVNQINGSIESRAVGAVQNARLRGGSFANAFRS